MIDFYSDTSAIAVGDEVGILYGLGVSGSTQIKRVVRRSDAGNVWVEGETSPFNRHASRPNGSRRDRLITPESARSMIAEQEEETTASRLYNMIIQIGQSPHVRRGSFYKDRRVYMAEFLRRLADFVEVGDVEGARTLLKGDSGDS